MFCYFRVLTIFYVVFMYFTTFRLVFQKAKQMHAVNNTQIFLSLLMIQTELIIRLFFVKMFRN